ncbi:MAG: ATP-dependent DNA ligase [Candidatus Eisenbacteria bacterium]|nr:ATP-dependent DNA ligase [Candidatus Latescibacterota bacterium]MBD3301704.1 ATP-dependent DNA ligase [Candidatus Eisenbacteria bacterium]
MAPEIEDLLDEKGRELARKKRQPAWTAPMLAVLADETFSDPDWIFERKLDGERCLVFKSGSRIRLRSRNKKELNDTYPELVDALEKQPIERFIADGEIVAFERSVTSFARLQARIGIKDPNEARRSGVAVTLYLFDLLHCDGYDLTALPLRSRKSLLKRLLEFRGRVRYTPHRKGAGEKTHREACRKGWEGVIAKRGDGKYVHARSKDWLKFKCVNRQEFVVGGYTDPQGSRVGLGALLVGYNEDGDLRYAGKVGTGYDRETLRDLAGRLRKKERKKPPFSAVRPIPKGVHWVTPDLVVEIGFTEWTEDGRLRHPRFLGIRTDKDPKTIERERPGRR